MLTFCDFTVLEVEGLTGLGVVGLRGKYCGIVPDFPVGAAWTFPDDDGVPNAFLAIWRILASSGVVKEVNDNQDTFPGPVFPFVTDDFEEVCVEEGGAEILGLDEAWTGVRTF